MTHTMQHAQRWLALILQQPLPNRDLFSRHIKAGEITSLCECGCHGFGFTIPDGIRLAPLKDGSGLFCEIAFESNLSEEIDILLFTDSRGYFCGADVMFGFANIEPMPNNATATKLIGIWPSV